MSVIRKVICDCCGKEIEGHPYRVKIVRQNPFTDDLDDKYVYEDNDQDLCLGCASRAMEFMVNLTVVKNTCKKSSLHPCSAGDERGAGGETG